MKKDFILASCYTCINKVKKYVKNDQHLIDMYNDFIDAGRKTIFFFSDLSICLGEIKSGEKSLEFILDCDGGFTDDEITDAFSGFIKKYPHASISYNKRKISVFEDLISSKADSIIRVI
jgi:hypothetical protein